MPNTNEHNNYLSIDFYTLIDRYKDMLSKSKLFEDYDFRGSNISVLIELMSYMTELNTYYINKLAKNTYLDTADIYENVHRLSNYIGYEPFGYIASVVDIQIKVKNIKKGDILNIARWYEFNVEGDNNTTLTYTITEPFNIEVREYLNNDNIKFETNIYDPETEKYYNEFTFNITAIQGKRLEFEYSGSDIMDNMILLPDKYTYACNPDYKVISLYVNNYEWYRVNDFFDKIDTNNVFVYRYDKYKRPVIEFGLSRNIPHNFEKINIILLDTKAADGTVGPGDIKEIKGKDVFIRNNNKDGKEIPRSDITIRNLSSSIRGSNPEKIDEIKYGAKEQLKSQYRNVTQSDYIGYLKSKSDIDNASVWGEKEISHDGHTMDYNRVYISIIPTNWDASTVKHAIIPWISDDTIENPLTTNMIVPSGYDELYRESIINHIEPREIISTEKVFILPRLIYFSFDIGIKVKKPYTILNIIDTFKRKLSFYFNQKRQGFNTIIDFKDIHNFMLDLTIRNASDNFLEMRSVDNIIFRDIMVSYPPGGTYYPSGSLSKTSELEFPMFWDKIDIELPYDNKNFMSFYMEDKLYIYGGDNRNNRRSIININLKNPSDGWSSANRNLLPIPLHSSHIIDTFQYLYFLSGYDINTLSKRIFRINKEKPMEIEERDENDQLFRELPYGFIKSDHMIIDNDVYIFGGRKGASHNHGTDEILKSNINDPFNYEILHDKLPIKISGHRMYHTGDYIYLIGGITHQGQYNRKIYRSSISNPTIFVDTLSTLPFDVIGFELIKIGKFIYIFGGENGGKYNTIYRTNHLIPLTWEKVEYTLPYNVSNYRIIKDNDILYIVGGGDNEKHIMKAHIMGNVLYKPNITGSYIYEHNYDNKFPHYTISGFDEFVDNKIRPIKIGFNDFPALAMNKCKFTEEF